jgi:peptide/nickel transport system ATP-binding protein
MASGHATPEPSAALLSIRSLTVAFETSRTRVTAVDDVSLELAAGRRVAVVGESGSGKSTLAHAILGLLDPPGRIVGGEIWFDGRDLGHASERELLAVRGRRVAMVFQDALGSLNPVLSIGRQLRETIRLHRGGSARDADVRAAELLGEVGISNAAERLTQYPHEFSGGMRQRVMIALALASDPELLIADEPTSALDVTTQLGVLALLDRLARDRNMAVLLITHDLGLIAGFADDVLVMYAGAAVEFASVDDVFTFPRHPYTRGLIASVPRIHDIRRHRLPSIAGTLPTPGTELGGCRFRPRCYLWRGRERCVDERPLLGTGRGDAACHFTSEVDGPGDPLTALRADSASPHARTAGEPLLTVDGVTKDFVSRHFGRRLVTHAVRQSSFVVQRGESVGLVGESGSGKSTLARLVLGLLAPDSGSISLDGQPLRTKRGVDPHRRGRMQAVFQDPTDSLDPMMSVARIVGEPLRLALGAERTAIRPRVDELLTRVGLAPEHATRRPLELSGGQRQRVAIARALATEPTLLVLDEAVSSLDVSVRAQILNLLAELREAFGLSYLFISHDLSVVRHACDRVIVMRDGAFVEEADVETLFRQPTHPYTIELLAAVPEPDPEEGRRRLAERRSATAVVELAREEAL